MEESSSDAFSFAEKWGKHVSSSAIRRLLKEGNVSRANLFLDDVGNDEDHGFAGGRQLPQSGHSVGVADGLQSGVVQAVPVLRQAFRVGYGLAGDEHIGVVGQVGGCYCNL